MLQLETATATLTNLNLRTEKIGKTDRRPAADIKFTIDVHNTALDMISPGLLKSLYRGIGEPGHQGDLTVDITTLTTLRHPRAKPWASTEDWPGYTARIDAGDFDIRSVDIEMGTLKGITCDPKEGGTVVVSFSIGCHPSGEDVGALYELMGKQVALTIRPPAVGDLERLRAEAKQKPAEASDEDDGDDDPADLPAGRAFPDAIDARGDKPPSARRASRLSSVN